MLNRCLYCYQELDENQKDFHPRCSRAFFGTDEPPALNYNLQQMAELAATIVQRSVTILGVQPKLSLTLVKDTLKNRDKSRLTIITKKPPKEVALAEKLKKQYFIDK